jgi:beta-glucosidase-like glycosyl hydrolase
VELQATTLEAVVKAVEAGDISRGRIDDALKRLRTAKERFLATDRPKISARLKELRSILGRDEHQAIAAEMAAFL